MEHKKKKWLRCMMLFLTVTLLALPLHVSAASNVKLNKTKISMFRGKSYTLKLRGASGTIKWSSSKKTVAVVSKNGKITAKRRGTTVITAKYGRRTYRCKVTVKQPVTSVTLNKKSISLTEGKTYTLRQSVAPLNASNRAVSWSSSDKTVATVTFKGKVKAISKGAAVITVKAKDGSQKTAVCKVIVKKAKEAAAKPETMKLDRETLSLTVGESSQLGVTGAGGVSVYWGSSNRNIVSVSSKGLVTAKAAGSVLIAARKSDGSQTVFCRVTVTEKAVRGSVHPKAKQLLSILQRYSNQIEADYGTQYVWSYGGSGERSTWKLAYSDSRKKGRAVCNCALLVRWGMREMGILDSKNFWGTDGGEIHFGGNSKEQLLKHCEIIKVFKTPNQLLKEGNLLPGDICTWVDFNHTNVYAGDGLWYDAGRGSNYVNGVFRSFGPSATMGMSNRTVGYIIRFVK